MKKKCAWCNEDLGDVTGDFDNRNTITHGICEVCLDALFPEDRKKLTALLDSFPAPVVVVDSGGIVLTANGTALKSLGKELSDVENYAGGDVFECAFAK